MIALTENRQPDVWEALAAPLPPGVIQWRQQGRPQARDGRYIARFVAYIDAQFVRERFDAACPGEWDLTFEALPKDDTVASEGDLEPFAFKARLQVLGVIRESVGQGRDYKTAETDAFKRAAVRFGVGHELYAMEQLWVQMDGDGQYAKPVEDPAVVYARKHGAPARPTTATSSPVVSAPVPPSSSPAAADTATGPLGSEEASCPKCGGRMWDNRLTKRNPKAPDYKCRDRNCDGVIWPPKEQKPAAREAVEQGLEMEEIPF